MVVFNSKELFFIYILSETFSFNFVTHYLHNNFCGKIQNLYPTDDGKSSEESHGASNETQLGLGLDLLVSLDVVKGGRVKVDLHQLKS